MNEQTHYNWLITKRDLNFISVNAFPTFLLRRKGWSCCDIAYTCTVGICMLDAVVVHNILCRYILVGVWSVLCDFKFWLAVDGKRSCVCVLEMRWALCIKNGGCSNAKLTILLTIFVDHHALRSSSRQIRTDFMGMCFHTEIGDIFRFVM